MNDIDQSCPADLEPYEKAHNKEIEEKDLLQHLWWQEYGISAFIYAIDHTFAKNPKSEFVKEPILSKIQTDGELTEEQKQRELDAFIRQNERMRSNWKRKHHKDSSVS